MPAMIRFSYALLLLLVSVVKAQNTKNTDTATEQTTGTATQQATTAQATTTKQTDTVEGTTAKATQATITDLPTLNSGSETTSSTDAPTTDITNAPSISSATPFHLTGVPTIAGYGIPTAIVPWTDGAPFMHQSQLPEGTVFIAVGAILGFMGASILAWRGLVAWSLHRSVKRAAANALQTDPMTKHTKSSVHYAGLGGGMGSTHSLDRLSAVPTGRLTKTTHGHPPSNNSPAAARNSSLFFSPTAGAGNHSSPTAAILNQGANRSSAYLPAGYYAAPGAASPASGAATTTLGGDGSSRISSLNPLHPSRAGYTPQRDFGPSPPSSPSLPPSRHNGGYDSGYGGQISLYSQQSPSSLNLHIPGGNANGGRAPSANLEELFENHGNGPRERF